MKDKVFYTKAVEAVESLARELRAYSSEPMYFSMTIFTRDENCHHEGDPDGIPDFYAFRFCEDVEEPSFKDDDRFKTARIYYSDDGKILKVIDYYNEKTDEGE